MDAQAHKGKSMQNQKLMSQTRLTRTLVFLTMNENSDTQVFFHENCDKNKQNKPQIIPLDFSTNDSTNGHNRWAFAMLIYINFQ